MNTPQWPLGLPGSSYVRLQNEVDRRLREHIELLAMVKRLSFLLNSARLVISHPEARDRAEDAVREAEQLLAKVAR